MTTPDPTAVQAAAERVNRYHSPGVRAKSVYGMGDADNFDAMRRDCEFVALAEHDPTPLTVEVLVGMGGNREGETIHWNGFEILAPFPESTTWRWWYRGSRQHHPPRTAGELRQLLMRME